MESNGMHNHSGHNHELLIKTILECALACEMCMSACLDEKDVTPMAYCIELDRDCSEICFLAAKLLKRDSGVAHKFLAVCEIICQSCAEECSKHKHDHCRVCAEACRKCAEACRAHKS